LPAFWARLSGRGLAIGTGPHLGAYQGGVALVRVAAGLAGDRWRRHKEVAVAGYGLSAACRLALLTAGTAQSTIGAIVLADRTGKGTRTAPRDAMISRSTPSDQLGTAFGVHHAMDTTGALIGPLLAFAILAAASLAFRSLSWSPSASPSSG
jgi:hypothetical protein